MSDTTIVVEFTPYDTLQTTDVITVGSTNILSGGASGTNRLDALEDVSEGLTPVDNSTLVYNASTDKYEVKELDLDGGTF